MAKDLNREAKIRLAWTTEMRRFPRRQCHDAFQHGKRGCALHVLREIAGIPNEERIEVIGAAAGLDARQSWEVVHRNDGIFCRAMTFPELSDLIEGWFK